MTSKTASLAVLTFLAGLPVLANNRAQGDCMIGGNSVVTGGVASQSRFMQSYVTPAGPGQTPTIGCTITIYITGSGGTLASIFSDNLASPTPLTNPFTADNTGHWFFYAATGHYDVQMSGAGISAPRTLGDIPLGTLTLSLTDFGARCDGSTNDFTAIQNGMNVTAVAGAALSVPPSVCMFSAATSFAVPSGLTMTGQGQNTSILRAINNTSVTNQALMAISSGSNISLSGWQLDGNQANQTATNVSGFSILGVNGFTASGMELQNFGGEAILGANWTNFTFTRSLCQNYGYTSSFGGRNLGCIQLDFNVVSAPSTNIVITDNTIDGSGAHVGGIKLGGVPPTNITNYIDVSRNVITDGDAGALQGTLGIELFSATHLGYGIQHFKINGNTVHGESSSSPTDPTRGETFGISVCGGGGRWGEITGNIVNWIGLVSLELCGPDITATANVIDTSGNIVLNNSTPSDSGFQFDFDGDVIASNTFYNPVSVNNNSSAITIYNQSGNKINGAVVANNTITYLNTGVSATTPIINIEANTNSSVVTGTIVTGNNIFGPGSGTTLQGVLLACFTPCTNSYTTVVGNVFSAVQTGVAFAGDTQSRILTNTYVSVGAKYSGSEAVTTAQVDTVDSATAVDFPSVTPTTNYSFGNNGQYIQSNPGSSSPNVITWNAFNSGSAFSGGIISTNSRYTTNGDSPANGWKQTSTSSVTRAEYLVLGACQFAVGYGPAAGSPGFPPVDDFPFSATDTNTGCTTLGVQGGVSIGNTPRSLGERITNYYIGKTTWNPGTVTAGGTQTTNVGVGNCNPGDLTNFNLSTVIGSTGLIPYSVANSGSVTVGLFNPTASPITPSSGTLTWACIQTN